MLSASKGTFMIRCFVDGTVTLFLCPIKIMKWSCFVSFHHDIRVTLFETGVLSVCLYPTGKKNQKQKTTSLAVLDECVKILRSNREYQISFGYQRFFSFSFSEVIFLNHLRY